MTRGLRPNDERSQLQNARARTVGPVHLWQGHFCRSPKRSAAPCRSLALQSRDQERRTTPQLPEHVSLNLIHFQHHVAAVVNDLNGDLAVFGRTARRICACTASRWVHSSVAFFLIVSESSRAMKPYVYSSLPFHYREAVNHRSPGQAPRRSRAGATLGRQPQTALALPLPRSG